MSDESLYLVKLQFQSGVVGGGSMEIQFAVDSKTGSLNGRANSSIHLISPLAHRALCMQLAIMM